MDFGTQGLEGLEDELSADLDFLFRGTGRVTQGVRNRYGRNDPVRPDRQGDRDDRADMDHRQAASFDFLYKRCTATRTGSSGGGDDDGIDSVPL